MRDEHAIAAAIAAVSISLGVGVIASAGGGLVVFGVLVVGIAYLHWATNRR